MIATERIVQILLVEDNIGDIRLIQEMFKDISRTNFQVVQVVSLHSALEILAKQKFDAILLDLTLDDSFGIETVKKILTENLDIPIIVLTGMDNNEIALEAVKIGAEDYLVKGSVDNVLLERSINYAIERFQIKRELKRSEELIRDSYNRVNFYKDLFTHDMNNILQNVLTSTELCSEHVDKPEEKKIAQKILNVTRDQIFRGAQLVKNVRKLSQLEEIQMETYPIELNEVLNKSIKFLKQNFKNLNISININPIEDIKLQANSFLNDIFDNLLVNSVRHNEKEQIKIIVKISRINKGGKSYVKIELLDNGVGIEDIWKLSIFRRGISEVKTLSGMGLGLSLVKKIIDSYNGDIYIEDRVQGDFSQGSSFIIEIPEVI